MLRRLADVRVGEGAAVLWSFTYFACLLSGYFVLRPLRETMGTAVGGVDSLAWLFTATFVAMLLAAPLFAFLASRARRRRIVPLLYHFFAIHLVGFFIALQANVALADVAKVFFVWVSVYNLFIVSAFWSLMADTYTSEQAKRLYGLIAAGGSAGAIVGPLVTIALVERIGVAPLVLLSAVLLEACVLCIAGLRRATASVEGAPDIAAPTTDERIGGGVLDGLVRVARSPYLAAICLQMLLFSATSTFLYMEQARLVAEHVAGPEARAALFARMDLAVNVINVSVQVFLTGKVMTRLGLAAALAFLPILTGLGFAALAAAQSLAVVVVFQVLRRSGHHAIDRPARETLFTVVPPDDKYKSKSFIDTVVYRGGDALSAWAPKTLRDAGLPPVALSLVALPLALCWLVVNLFLSRKQRELEAARGSEAESLQPEVIAAI